MNKKFPLPHYLVLLLIITWSSNVHAQIKPSYFKGNSTATQTIPLNQASQHTQILYTPSDFHLIPNSGKITGIYMRHTIANPTTTYTNFRISFGQTTDSIFANNTFRTNLTVGLPDTTITISSAQTAGNWVYIPITIPFIYDSTKSLIVDFYYTANSSGISTYSSTSVGTKRISGTNLTSLTGSLQSTHNDFGMDVIPLNICTTPIFAGTASSSISGAYCPNIDFVLSSAGHTIGEGQYYRWEGASSASGPYTPISDSMLISQYPLKTPLTTTYYRLAATCESTTAYSNSVTITINPPLPAGTYTINPSQPASSTNYQSITQAITDLACGINGPITFELADTIFNERVIIPVISGASETNTITFKGAGKSSTIITSASTGTGDMATITLNDADYIIIRDLTIRATSAANSAGIMLHNNADYNKIINVRVELDSTGNSTSTAGIIGTGSLTSVTSTGSSANHTLVDSVEVNGGYYGVRFNGISGTNPSVGNVITNSTLTSQYYYAIYIISNSYFVIANNHLSNLRNSTSYGVYTTGTSNYKLFNNKIYASAHGALVSTNLNNYDSSYHTLVANNMIATTSSGSHYGLQLSSVKNTSVWHNSISSNGVGQYATVYINASEKLDFRNNILINNNPANNSHVLNMTTSGIVDSMDYNNYYSRGGGLVYLSATSTYNDLLTWQTNQPNFNVNSTSLDPRVISPTSLYLNPASPAMFGTYVGIDTDIDSMPRSLTQPTMGAQERIIAPINIATIGLTQPSGLFCKGNYDVYVGVRNKGSLAINSYIVQWEHNGVLQPAINMNEVLDTVGSDAGSDKSIYLGTFNYKPGEPHLFKIWTESPNNIPDPIMEDDTITVISTNSLSDTLTIGGVNPNYATFIDAVDALKTYGVCGPVVFNVRPGIYNERIVIPSILGASSTNTIVFEGTDKINTIITDSGTGTADLGTVVLNGADYITFKNMTIDNTGLTNAAAVMISNNADSNQFINTILSVKPGTATTMTVVAITNSLTSISTSGVATGNYNIFEGVEFIGGYYGLRITGASTTDFNKGNSALNCVFDNQYYYAFYSTYHGNFVFKGNVVKNLRNTINYGAYLTYSSNIIIEANNIAANSGIYLSTSNKTQTNGSRNKIINNMVKANNSYGLFISSADSNDIYHNTIVGSGTNTNAPAYFSSSVNNDFRNNIIVNRNTADNAHAVNIPTTATFISVNNNNYYSYGGGFAYISASTSYSNLASWKAAQQGYNQASFSEEPIFISNNDLHLKPIGPILRGANLGITKDIDGATRDNNPTVGAHERFIYSNSIGISEILPSGFCEGNHTIQAKVMNIGNNKVNSFMISWTINGNQMQNIFVTEPLDTFGSAQEYERTIDLGSWYFSSGVNYEISASLHFPNAETDPYTKDDTLTKILRTGLAGQYTIGGPGANFSTITEAVNTLNISGICESVDFYINAGEYEEQLSFKKYYSSSPDYTVTFQSATQDSASVIIWWPTGLSAAENHLISLDEAENITFKYLTFERREIGSHSTIFTLNRTSNITITNNLFLAPLTITSETDGSRTSIYSNDLGSELNTVIRYNHFFQNANAISFNGMISTNNHGTIITNNIVNSSYCGVWLKHNNSAKVQHNYIYRAGGTPTVDFFPISLENCDSAVNVSYNKIIHQRGSAIRLLGCNGSSETPIGVYNNTITAEQTGSTTSNGIAIESNATYNSEYINVYHNTVLVNSENATTARAVYMTGTTASKNKYINFINNIFQNTGIGYVYYLNTNSFDGDVTFANNNIYTKGSNIGTWNSTVGIPNDGLRSWINVTNQDLASSNILVTFLNDTSLLLGGNSLGNFNLATNIKTYVIDDIIGNSRTTTYYYKGAHEGISHPLNTDNVDISIWSITSPTKPLLPSGMNTITLQVRNNGLNTVHRFNYEYSINGNYGSIFTWTGTLTSTKTVDIDLSDLYLDEGTYTFKFWLSKANNKDLDLNFTNDTIELTIKVADPLTGTYTVGVGEDFLNLTAIADSLSSLPILGDLVFELTSNYVSSDERFPIIFSNLDDNTNIITIRPADGISKIVTQGNPATTQPLIELSGISNLVLDGRAGGNGDTTNWIIRNKSTAATKGSTIRLINGATNNVLKYLQIEGHASSTSYSLIHFSTSTSLKGGNSNNQVLNNILRDNSDTITVPTVAQAIYSSGTAAYPNENNEIKGNYISNFNNYGIYLTTGSGNNWTIENNHFYNNRTTASTAAHYPIYISSPANTTNYQINGNYIGGSAPFTLGNSYKHNGNTAFVAINSGAYLNVSISNNTIKNIESIYSAGTSHVLRAIVHNEKNSTAIIKGNTIANIKTKTKSTAFANDGLFAFGGIAIPNCDSLIIANNVIKDIQVADPSYTDAITVSAISFTNSAIAYVYNNRIANIVNLTKNNSRTVGIMAMNVPENGIQYIYNNSISLYSNTQPSLAGIMHNSNSMQLGKIEVFNNSIYIGGTPSEGNSTSYGIYRQFATKFKMLNNAVYMERNGNQRALFDNGNQIDFYSNYNFFIQASNAFTTNSTELNFDVWRALGNDTFSYYTTPSNISSNALFTLKDSAYLSPVTSNPQSWALNGKGISITDLTSDLLGNARNNTIGIPIDIGAYEFTPNSGVEPTVIVINPESAPSTDTIYVYNRPVAQINWVSGTVPTNVSFKYYSGIQASPIDSANAIYSYYTIEADEENTNFNIELAYTPAEIGTVTENNLKIAHRNIPTTNWNYFSNSQVNSIVRTVRDTMLNVFGIFTLTDKLNPLPIKLSSFNATKINKNVLVKWTTTSEMNTNYFILEASTNGKHFTPIGKVKANGNSSTTFQYNYLHENAQTNMGGAATIYYRLISVDYNNADDISQTINVVFNNNSNNDIKAYPNPFNGRLTINFEGMNQNNVTVQVLNMQGTSVMKLHKTIEDGNTTLELNNLDNLESGVYFVRIINNDEVKTIKVVKQ